MKKYVLNIPDMACGHCVKRITKALEEKGFRSFEVILENKSVVIETDNVAFVLETLEEAGYSASVA